MRRDVWKWGGMRERIRLLVVALATVALVGGFSLPAYATTGGGVNSGSQYVAPDADHFASGALAGGPDLTGIPAAQQRTGQSPVGYVGMRSGGSSLYFNLYLVTHAQLVAEFATPTTYTSNCYWMGVNRFHDPTLNDGVERWLCEVHRDADCSSCLTLPQPVTLFWKSLYDWSYGTTRFVTTPYTATIYKYAINPVTHNISADFLKLAP